jgi:hypothetical protein
MISKDKNIFISFHSNDEIHVQPLLAKIRAAGWNNLVVPKNHEAAADLIQKSSMAVIFLSKSYAGDDRLIIEHFSYLAVIMRKPFLPVWLDKQEEIEYKIKYNNPQILSALLMLVAKHPGIFPEKITESLANFKEDVPEYTPTTPQVCEKPCEAYEGNEPYAFISYAHDNAPDVYPVIKDLYKHGWDFWYDEGIKTTQQYLPVIADYEKRSSVLVLMLTPRCLNRPFVINYELEFALRRGVPVIPVMLQEIHEIPTYISPEVVKLIGNAIFPDEISPYLEKLNILINRGEREAIPPAIRQNVVYDVVLPPELPGFEIAVIEAGITINKYLGNETDVLIPKEVKTVDGMVFPVVRIHETAFLFKDRLTSVNIPSSITTIGGSAGGHAFYGCTNLKKIIVSKDNKKFSSDDGVLFDKSKSVLIAFPEAKVCSSYSIPDSVKTIYPHAFKHCNNLLSLTLPDSVKEIDQGAFIECDNLTIHCSSGRYKSDSFPYKPYTNDLLSDNTMQLLVNVFSKFVKLPHCDESPYALICCADDDLPAISELIIEMYWDGFSVRYSKKPSEEDVQNSACVLVFISENTEKSEESMLLLQKAIAHDKSNIIQVFLGECTNLPDSVSNDLRDRQAIIQSEKSKAEFEGLIKESLRSFKCTLNHPRGFEAVEDNGARITKFIFTGFFPFVIIPKTFFNPPLSVTSIGEFAFNNLFSVKSIIIPDSVKTIGPSAFIKCMCLESITIPDSVNKIGVYAFSECEELKSVTIGNGVKSISWYTFLGCNKLVSVTIGDSVESIGGSAFYECKSLASITIPSSVKSIGERAFQSCASLESITIPGGVKKIEERAFQECASLVSVVFEDGVESIGVGSFCDCPNLENITLPESIKKIEDGAFYDCVGLKTLRIPDSVTYIGEEAFSGCTHLVIRCKPNSYAELYAKENNIKYKSTEPNLLDRLFKKQK